MRSYPSNSPHAAARCVAVARADRHVIEGGQSLLEHASRHWGLDLLAGR